jgi:hypothetical protein
VTLQTPGETCEKCLAMFLGLDEARCYVQGGSWKWSGPRGSTLSLWHNFTLLETHISD